jgi:hypothetical protein
MRFERLTGAPIDSWAGLESLVSEQVPEGSELDYKLRAYDDPATPRAQRNNELRKDVTALANAVGGVIVCGISDHVGLPGKILGVGGSLEALEGSLRQTMRSRVWPLIDGVEIVPVRDSTSSDGCLLIVVPASARAPHAVEPHEDAEALKYARRVGRHTEWLSESQVADLYRGRFTAAQSQAERVESIIVDLTTRLSRRSWLLLAVAPDSPGEFTVSRTRVADAQQWWLQRRRLDLLPPIDRGPADASAGPRRIVLSRSDGQTAMPIDVHLELHDDGACGVALGLKDAPSGNPSFYLDDLVARTLESLVNAADFAVGQAGAGGYALVTAKLHFADHPGGEIHAWDPSWTRAVRLPGGTREAHTTHTVDLEAIQASNAEAVAATALVVGHLAQFFGEPDAKYLTAAGAIRVNEYEAATRDRLLIPRAAELGVPVERGL